MASKEQCSKKFGDFEAISAFPKVIGAINGTHINIPSPHINLC